MLATTCAPRPVVGSRTLQHTSIRCLSGRKPASAHCLESGPITVDTDDVLEQAAHWRAEGHGVALATVVRTWGSSPRPAGSQLAVNERGAFVGSVSGGCIEGAVIDEALAIMIEARRRACSSSASPTRRRGRSGSRAAAASRSSSESLE